MARFGFVASLLSLISHSRNSSLIVPRGSRAVVATKLIPLLGAFLYFAALGGGQVTPGNPSWSAMDCHEVDCVNLQNGNILLTVPVHNKAGAMAVSFNLNANSYMYVPTSGGVNEAWEPSMAGLVATDPVIFNASVNNTLGVTNYYGYSQVVNATCPNKTATVAYTNWWVMTGDGTVHPLPPTDYTLASPCATSFTDLTIDGSGFKLSATAGVTNSVYDKSGKSLTKTSITDSNGNTISMNCMSGCTWVDTMGLPAITWTDNGSPQSYSWTDVNGGSPTVTQLTSNLTLETVFGCSGIPDLDNSSASALVTGFSFPDGTSLGIGYETTPGHSPNVTGRLGSLTLRERGTIDYSYSGSNNGINCTYQMPETMKRITTAGTTTYNFSPSSSGVTTTVTDNGGNETVYSFTYSPTTGAGILTQVTHYQGASTLLTTDTYCYNNVSPTLGCATLTVPLPITQVDIYHAINGMPNSSRTTTAYDMYGNVTYEAQYDFGATTATRTITIAYGTWNGTNCVSIANTINNKPCDVLTTQGGVKIADSHFTYDSHGDLTTTSVWNGSSWIGQTTANTFNSNGTPSATYDLANSPTTYGYSSSSYTSCGSCTQYPFATSVSKGGLATYSTWNGTGGVKVTDEDASRNTTIYGYTNSSGTADPYWRVMSVTDPLSNEVWKTYASSSSPDSANSSFAFNSGSSIQNRTLTTDEYGRPTNAQAEQSPSATNYDTVTTNYNWSTNYQTVATSQPCSTTSGSSCATVHTSYYDPLGRLYERTTSSNETLKHTYAENDDLAVLSPAPANENNKQVQKEYDGLGRLTKSCAIGNGSTTPCGQNTGSANGVTASISYTSVTGSTTTTSTLGSQSRSNTYDALGRLTQKVTPEGGTWNYYYDVVSGCTGSVVGKLGKVTDPNGNSICYAYDSLGRVTKVNANGAICRLFYYDNSTGFSGTIPSGIAISNSYGRMAEAATSNCSTTLLTDLWFSYDADGHVTNQWESTPNSGQYYESIATFFGNGAVNTLQLASPSEYTMTYGIDGEGRWSSLQKSSTQSYVTGTAYNAAGQPTQIVLTGTGPDQDDFVYDPNTGRMTEFTFQVGNTPATMVGQLYWNPNGTLNNLAITDGFNAGGTQTCYYNPLSGTGMGYDDWERLLNVSCGTSGSIWNQIFSYDQYNNITKSSSGPGVSWMPGYSSSTNHYTLTGTTYDLNGDLTYDSVHNYTWNPFSKLSSVDQSGTNCATRGECIVYDALGRAVEIDNGSIHAEIWYTQLGKTAFMNGSTLSFARWPTPGGGTELIGTSSQYMHKDWLGNARILSTTNGHLVSSDMAFAPYGEIYDEFGTTGTEFQMFTGDTQDVVSGMMNTPNREYNSAAQGRWLSPDPLGSGWNQYAYATNPLSLTDPTGLSPVIGCPLCGRLGLFDANTGQPGQGNNGELGLFAAEIAYFQSGYYGLDTGYENVGSGGSSVVADSGSGTGDGPSNLPDAGALWSYDNSLMSSILAITPELPQLAPSDDPNAPASLVLDPDNPIATVNAEATDGSEWINGSLFRSQLTDRAGDPMGDGIQVTEVVAITPDSGNPDGDSPYVFSSSQKTGSASPDFLTGPGQILDFVGMTTLGAVDQGLYTGGDTTTQSWYAVWNGRQVGLTTINNQALWSTMGGVSTSVTNLVP